MHRAFLVFLLLSFAGPAAAQSIERTLSGIVVRSDNQQPIEAAAVAANGKAVVSDKDGRFALTGPAGKWRVEVAAPGFFLLATTVDVSDRDVTGLELALAKNAAFTQAVDVVGTAPMGSPSAMPVAPQDVLKTPGALDNVFRTLQTLPGVAATEEFGSRLTVRGGAPDQNLTVMDGVEIHDPYRLFGLTSAFNPEIIRRFELATSGFSAKYGDRLSSLLLIENRDGNASRKLGGSAAASITDSNIVLEGKLPNTARGSWLITGRRTYYDLIAERITDQTFPKFADVQAKATWETAAGGKLSVFGLRSRQSADIRIEEGRSFGEFGNATRNDLAWARFDTGLGRRGRSMSVAGYSNTVSSLDAAAEFRDRSQRSNAPFDSSAAFGRANVQFSQHLEVRDVSFRQEFAWALGKHTIEAGGEFHHLTTTLQYVITGDRNPAAANGSSVQGGAGLPDLLDSARQSSRGGGWLIDTFRWNSRASIEAGLRFDHAGINNETTLSPRMTATLALTPRTNLRAAIGRYTQSPGYEKSSQSDYVLDLTAATARSLKSERALLASLGVEQTVGRGLTARVEGYYKRIDDVIIGQLETDTELAARLARYNFPAALASSIPTERIITTTPINGGRGRAWGADVLVSRMTAPASARIRGWISYTWGRAEREAYARTYAFEYDRRHAVSAVASWKLSNKWELASTVRWATGFPRTAPLGVRVAGQETTNGSIVPARDSAGNLMYSINLGGVSNINNARLPDFARVDMRLTWKPRGTSGRWEFYLEVINVADRKNASVLSAELDYNPGSDRPRIVETPDQSIPRVPTFGLRWRF